MREINQTVNLVVVARLNTNSPVPLFVGNLLTDQQSSSREWLPNDACFVDHLSKDFRRAVELKYRLMPYIYAQAKAAAEHGYPMLRTLFFEYPDDPTSWLIEDEYLFGSDLLVAPLFAETDQRRVYLPPGTWIDYQTGRRYPGAGWHDIRAGEVPIILLARNGAVIPHIGLAQSTAQMNWTEIELRVFGGGDAPVTGLFAPPNGELYRLELRPGAAGYALAMDPLRGKVHWRITR